MIRNTIGHYIVNSFRINNIVNKSLNVYLKKVEEQEIKGALDVVDKIYLMAQPKYINVYSGNIVVLKFYTEKENFLSIWKNSLYVEGEVVYVKMQIKIKW